MHRPEFEWNSTEQNGVIVLIMDPETAELVRNGIELLQPDTEAATECKNQLDARLYQLVQHATFIRERKPDEETGTPGPPYGPVP